MTGPVVMPPRPSALKTFDVAHPIFGVVHLRALPGAPMYDGEPVRDIYAAGVRDARTLAEGGIDAIIVENASDQPFLRPELLGHETVAGMTAACMEIRAAVTSPLGVTCVANGAIPGIAIAKAAGATWVRVNQWANAYVANEGIISSDAGSAMRYRKNIGATDVNILADVHVKFGAHSITADRSISEQATDAEWHLADVLIATGTRTGSPTSPAEVKDVRSGTSLPVIVGSGLDPEQVPALFDVADGAIVGQWLKVDGRWWNPVDPRRVEQLIRAREQFECGDTDA